MKAPDHEFWERHLGETRDVVCRTRDEAVAAQRAADGIAKALQHIPDHGETRRVAVSNLRVAQAMWQAAADDYYRRRGRLRRVS